MSVRSKIIAAMRQVAEEQKVTLPPLNDDVSLHETGLTRWPLRSWWRAWRTNSASIHLRCPRTPRSPSP